MKIVEKIHIFLMTNEELKYYCDYSEKKKRKVFIRYGLENDIFSNSNIPVDIQLRFH